MAGINRSDLRDLVFQRANMEDNFNFLPDDEMNKYINYAIRDYWDHVAESDNGEIYVKNAPILTKTGSYAFTLPSDYYKLRDVSYYDGGKYFRLQKADPSDYPQLTAVPPNKRSGRYFVRHNMETGTWTLVAFPTELQAAYLAVMYIPEPPQYTTDSQVIYFPNGWEDYVITQCAIWAKMKEDTDPSELIADLMEIKNDISTQVSYLDEGQPTTVRRIHRSDFNSWR